MVRDRVRGAKSAHRRPELTVGGDARPRPELPAREDHPRGLRQSLERVVLGVLTTLVSVNLWTGGPLLALWIGSRIQTAVGQLSMAAVGATIVILAVVTFVLYKLLAWLNTRYNAVIGRVTPRQQAPWLKPMSGERRSIEVKRPLSATERITVSSVVVAVLVFEVWFFFFAHYTFAQ
jgi:hypothetical protein